MISRALDENNDIFLLNGQIARVTDGAQVVQAVRSRLLFYRGEAIMDTAVGVPWLQSILGKPVDLPLTESLIKAEILQTPGVDSIQTYEQTFDRLTRELTVTYTALTTFGEISDELYVNRKIENFALTGTITGDIQSGVTVFLTGDLTSSTTSGPGGTYAFSVPNGTYTVTPDLTGYEFAPTSDSVTIADADETGIDFVSTQLNEVWNSCPAPGSQLAVFSPGHTLETALWICAGTLTPAYHAGYTSDPATDPTIFEQCGSTPADCSELFGIRVSDDFTGTDCNSISVGGFYWTLRGWAFSTSGTTTQVITSGELVLTSGGAGTNGHVAAVNNFSHAGELIAEVDCSEIPVQDGNYQYFGMRLIVGGVTHRIEIEVDGGTGPFWRAGTESVQPMPGVTWAPHTMKIVRNSSNLMEFYVDGNLEGTSSLTYTGTVTEVQMLAFHTAGGTRTFKFDYMSVTDESLNDIYIDVTGGSCT